MKIPPKLPMQYFQYLCVGVVGTAVVGMLIYAFTEWLHLWYMVSFVISSFLGSIINFTLNKLWVFKREGKDK